MANSKDTKMISVLSGKGGVGKSIIALNLSERLANQGYRVLLVDADFSSGNLHVLSNCHAEFGINEYVLGQCSLSETVVSVAGFDLLATSWNEALAEERSLSQTVRFVDSLQNDTREYDFVIFDHSSGRSKQAVVMAHACDLNLLVVVPELTSLADGYGLFKQIVTSNKQIICHLLVNRVHHREEADYIRIQMGNLTNQFLKLSPEFIGYISEDQLVRQAVASQAVLSTINPHSEIISQLDVLAQVVAQENDRATSPTGRETETQINKTTATADIRG